MSVAGKAVVARRPLLVWLVGLAGAAVVGIAAIEAPRIFAPRYAPTPFDDLFAKLPDRDNAARLGQAWLAENKAFDADKVAKALRVHLAERPLDTVIDSDLAGARIMEAHGWVLPETLVTLCALAARAG
jgi:hypothetical protein